MKEPWRGVEGEMAAAGGGWGTWAVLERRATFIVVLNLLDGLFTLTFLQLRLAEELNPLMRLAYARSPLAFMLLKLSSVHAGVLILWLGRSIAAARAALHAAAYLYAAITAYHLSYLAWLLLP